MVLVIVKVVVMVMIMAMVMVNMVTKQMESEQTWPPLQHTNSVHHAPTEASLQQHKIGIFNKPTKHKTSNQTKSTSNRSPFV